MLNHATLHDVAAIGGPRTTSFFNFIMFKNLAAISGIVVPSSLATQYDSSRAITVLLTQWVMAQEQDLGDSVASVRSKKQEFVLKPRTSLRPKLPNSCLPLILNKHVSLVSHQKKELLIG